MTKVWKVLNLYSGIGGNRKLWEDVDVTAVEIDLDIASVYQDFFPDDKVVVDDAHQYLLDHYDEFDFIWSSPPCPTHSVTNFFLNKQGIIRYPDMGLWQEIIFLKYFCGCKWVVENVAPYYESFITPFYYNQRHYFWSNFVIPCNPHKNDFDTIIASASDLQRLHGFDLSGFTVKNKIEILRNCVKPELGKLILDCAYRYKQVSLRCFVDG